MAALLDSFRTMAESEVRVRVTGYAPEPTEAVVRLDHLSPARRIGRGAKSFLIFFVLAVVSVAIPAAHFILVPGFLLAAVISLIVSLGVTTRVVGAHGSCPDCRLEQDFDLNVSWQLPQDFACRGCRRRLTLTPGPAPQG